MGRISGSNCVVMGFALVAGATSAQAGGAANASFSSVTYPLLGNTHITADFNGDGLLDLAGPGAGGAGVMLNTGGGGGAFGPRVNYAVGGQAQAVAAGDFNRDGKIDLAVSLNSPTFTLSLLLGNGDGTFGASTDFPNTTGADAPAIAATDIDNDNKLDVVITHTLACFTAPCTASQELTVMLGNGDGTFEDPMDTNVGTGMSDIAVGDFNHDGMKDLAICGDNTQLYILIGNGDGTFAQQPTIFLVPGGDLFSAGNDVDIANFNGDTHQDLAVALPGNGRGTAILIGNGNGTFQTPFRILENALDAPQSLAIADFNGDGAQDIARALGNGTGGLFDILHGNGDATFQPHVNYLVPPPQSSIGGGNFALGDFNNDAKPDLSLLVYGASPSLRVLTNTSVGNFCTADMVSSTTFAPPGDGTVDAADLAFLLGEWGMNRGSPADFVTSATFEPPPDGAVDAADLAVLLGAWGACD